MILNSFGFFLSRFVIDIELKRGNTGMVKRITNDEREDVMEDNLQQV